MLDVEHAALRRRGGASFTLQAVKGPGQRGARFTHGPRGRLLTQLCGQAGARAQRAENPGDTGDIAMIAFIAVRGDQPDQRLVLTQPVQDGNRERERGRQQV
jgi:hypothetical protein